MQKKSCKKHRVRFAHIKLSSDAIAEAIGTIFGNMAVILIISLLVQLFASVTKVLPLYFTWDHASAPLVLLCLSNAYSTQALYLLSNSGKARSTTLVVTESKIDSKE